MGKPDKSKSTNPVESKIADALKNLLREDIISEADSTLASMLKDAGLGNAKEEYSHNSQFAWEGLDDAFNLKVAGSPFKDSLTSAFMATHSYKYVDNPTFKLSFEKELKHRGLPAREIEKAVGHIDSLLKGFDKNPGEMDSGWHQNIEDMVDLTTNADSRNAKYTEPFSGGGLYPEGDKYDKGDLEGFDLKELKFSDE
jgi:hypothetical protein